MAEQIVLEIFSDYVCPFCWLGEQAVSEFVLAKPEVCVVRRAFELRPEPNPTLDPQGAYLTRVWRDTVYPMAERMGLPLRLPPVQPRSRLAHEAARFAAGYASLEVFHEAVFRAFFQRGEDIGQPDVLVAVGEGVGLDGVALRQALNSGEFEAEVLADEELAMRLGLHAVPAYYLAAGRRMATGVQSADELQRLVFGTGVRPSSALAGNKFPSFRL